MDNVWGDKGFLSPGLEKYEKVNNIWTTNIYILLFKKIIGSLLGVL